MAKLRFALASLMMLICFSALAQVPEDTTIRILSPYDEACREEIVNHLKEIKKTRPTVAVVLSGGGAKGAAHMGVLEELEKYGIPVDLVLGTSMGGLMGALYSMGHKPKDIAQLFGDVDWALVMNDRIPYRYRSYADKDSRNTYLFNLMFDKSLLTDLQLGRVYGMQVNNIFSTLSVGYQDSTSFAKLPIPFVCMASDVVTGKEKAWYGGKITQAMRSTMAIPGVFAPVEVDDMLLLDGGMLNNMPADVARDLGADYIICVSLGDLKKANSDYNLKSVGNFGFRLFTMGWANKVKDNYSIPDIVIQPNIDGFGMLSFDRESIDTLLQRGQIEARKYDAEFRALKQKIGSDTLVYQCKPAEEVFSGKVQIDSIEVIGLDGKAREQVEKLAKKHDIVPGSMVGMHELDDLSSRIYSTRAFNYVNYELLGTEAPYKLSLNCQRGPANQIGVGLRGDNEEIMALIFNYGRGTRAISGSSFRMIGKIGLNPYLKLRYSYKPITGPIFNVEASGKWVNMGKYFTAKYTKLAFSYRNYRLQAYVSQNVGSPIRYSAGIRDDYYIVSAFRSNYDLDNNFYVENQRMNYLSLFANVGRETFDDAYFPTSGYRLSADYQFVFKNLASKEKTIPDHTIAASATLAIPASERFTIMPSVMTRIVTGTNIPIPYNNVLGGMMFGRYLDQQLAFVGVTGVSGAYQYMGVARLDLRYRIGKIHYVSAIANGVRSVENFKDGAVLQGVGVGLEYALKTPVGPIRLQVASSNLSHEVAVGLSVGLDF